MTKLSRFLAAPIGLTLLSAAFAACSDSATDGPSSTSGTVASSSSSASTGSGGMGGAGGAGDPLADAVRANAWTKLGAAPSVSQGKQDDLWFFDAMHGFAASGPNEAIYETKDGGATWKSVFTHSGTYFRALVFVDPMHGFAGNIGAGLSPTIDDATLMYGTADGGVTWNPVTTVTGTAAKGLCNFSSIDATHLVGVGRANGPAALLSSNDAGATWTTTDLSGELSMIIDARFTSPTTGLVAGMDKAMQHCEIARTTDGGTTLTSVFKSKANGSLCWKLHFPSDQIGYAAVQDSAAGPATFAKTTDGGMTWSEMPLPPLTPANKGYDAVGIGFISDKIGWASAESPTLPTYRTFDGGATWEIDPALKSPINRFRFVDAHTAYAIGGAVWKLTLP